MIAEAEQHAKPLSFSCVGGKRDDRRREGQPVSTATGRHEDGPGRADRAERPAMTTRKTVTLIDEPRTATNSRCPASDVDDAQRRGEHARGTCRCHLIAPSTGQVDSTTPSACVRGEQRRERGRRGSGRRRRPAVPPPSSTSGRGRGPSRRGTGPASSTRGDGRAAPGAPVVRQPVVERASDHRERRTRRAAPRRRSGASSSWCHWSAAISRPASGR